MRNWRSLTVALAIVALPQYVSAQTLTFDLFERYLEALRLQTGIPGLSAAIVSNQQVVWERYFGFQDVDRSIRVSPDTAYLIGGLTQPIGATLAMQCAEEGRVTVSDPDRQRLMSHTDSAGVFHYDPARFAALTGIVTNCRGAYSFPWIVNDRILSRLAMLRSVPGHDIADSAVARSPFDPAALQQYDSVLSNLATPYRLVAGKATRSEYPAKGLDAATGLISTVRDLANFDAAFDANVLVAPATRAQAFTNVVSSTGAAQPTGLGWFVQPYNGKRIVWQFGYLPDAFSSLMIKVPESSLTLILLANSDGLSGPFQLANGDVTTSLFAQLFLRTFVP